MGNTPTDLRYTEKHEWIRIEGADAWIGITDFAQDALTEVVWVELPNVGSHVEAMEPLASVESVKSVSEIYAPVSGLVVEVNESLEDSPEVINQDPYGDGWICKISVADSTDLDVLLDASAYASLIGG